MNEITRREFVKLVNGGVVVIGMTAVGLPVLGYLYPPDTAEAPSEPIEVGSVDEIAIGQSKTVKYGRYPALVINTDKGLRAYSAVCTHFACLVKWDPENDHIMCPCHAAAFSQYDGSVLAGPPPRALDSLPVKVEIGRIYVGGAA